MTETTLTAEDILNTAKLIDLCCQRGTFNAAEMSEVGKVYDKYIQVLKLLEKEHNDAISKKSESQSAS